MVVGSDRESRETQVGENEVVYQRLMSWQTSVKTEDLGTAPRTVEPCSSCRPG